jgi:hypothetical protein
LNHAAAPLRTPAYFATLLFFDGNSCAKGKVIVTLEYASAVAKKPTGFSAEMEFFSTPLAGGVPPREEPL